MQNPRLATRYAKSLLDLAIEQNSLDATLSDVETIDQVSRASREFAAVLRSPVINADKKKQVIDAVIGHQLSPLTKAFVHLLTAKHREGVLPEIAAAFLTQYKEMKNIRVVKLTTAAPVSDTVREAIRTKVAASISDKTIEMTTAVDPSLIGGFVLELDNKIVDASIRRDLNDIKAQFMDNIYVSKLVSN